MKNKDETQIVKQEESGMEDSKFTLSRQTQAGRDELKEQYLKKIYIAITITSCLFFMYVSLFSADAGVMDALIYAFSPLKHLASMSFHPLLMGKAAVYSLILSALINVLIMSYNIERKEYDPKTVSGSAHWMTEREFKKYCKTKVKPELTDVDVTDKNWYSPNLILGEQMRRAVDMYYTRYNNNILVIGGSGAGKTRFYIKPGLLSCCNSFLCCDPSGEIIASVGYILREHNFKIKILNIHEMRYSNGYNSFEYIRDEKGIGELIDCFIQNTKNSDKPTRGDDFFENAERMLYAACICLLVNHIETKSLKNFGTVVKLVNMSDIDETGKERESSLDKIFSQLPYNSLAVKFYRAFKQGSGKTTKSIIISCLTRLQPFMYDSVAGLTQYDELELDKIGDEKTALFIITPQVQGPYTFLSSMLYHQLFDTIYTKGEKQLAEGGDPRMKYHICCFMDEFANQGGIIPAFPSKLSTMRKYNMSASIILQDKQQIESMYPENFLELVGNCDSKIYLGGGAPETQEWISNMLGDGTAITSSNSGIGGAQGTSKTYSKTNRTLLNPDEVDKIDEDACIIFTRNLSPMLDKKYDYLKHPLYTYTGDADKNRKFLYRKMTLFDNSNAKHKINLLQAERDLENFCREALISDAMEAKKTKISGGEIKNNDGNLFNEIVGECVGEFEDVMNDAVAIAEIYDLSYTYAKNIIEFVSVELDEKTPLIMLLNANNNKELVGVVMDTEHHTMYRLLCKSQYAKYSQEEQKNWEYGEALHFTLNKGNVLRFKNEINELYAAETQ